MKKIFLLVLTFFIVSTRTTFAQVSIGKFYSLGTNSNRPLDWVEIVNNTSNKINLKNYKIKDSLQSEKNTYGFEGDTYLDPGQSCVKEVGQILNKENDVIYLFDGEDQIFCLEYGASSTDCNQASNIGTDPGKPAAECISQTPLPTQSPTKPPTPTPTKPPTSTPKPTVKPTPEHTTSPDSTPSPQVLSTETRKSDPSPSASPRQSEEESPQEKTKRNYFAYVMIVAGIGFVGYAAYPLLKEQLEKYNKTHGQEENKPPNGP